VESAEDVATHMQLLDAVRAAPGRAAVAVRAVKLELGLLQLELPPPSTAADAPPPRELQPGSAGRAVRPPTVRALATNVARVRVRRDSDFTLHSAAAVRQLHELAGVGRRLLAAR
jgi:hypothetical protein